MILDHLNNHESYRNLHSAFPAAFDFLRRPDLTNLEPGRYEIDGSRLYAIIARDAGHGLAAARLEAHRKYIDIQYVASGVDVMGWRAAATCENVTADYDESKDILFYSDETALWLPVNTGHFAVFFPSDAHAPLAGDGPVHKVVVKVEVA